MINAISDGGMCFQSNHIKTFASISFIFQFKLKDCWLLETQI